MPELRKVRFQKNYWHVVNDEEGAARVGIIGTLLYMRTLALPWRAEFAPTWGRSEELAVGYFESEQEALGFLADKLEGSRDDEGCGADH